MALLFIAVVNEVGPKPYKTSPITVASVFTLKDPQVAPALAVRVFAVNDKVLFKGAHVPE